MHFKLRYTYGCILLLSVSSSLSFGHEGHQPLPTKGVTVDLKTGQVTLSRAARDVLDIKSVEVETRPVAGSVRAYAKVVAPWTRHAFVTSIAPGRIAKLLVRPGDAVKAGQALAELDSLDLQTLRLDYQQAQNELELSGQLLQGLIPAAKAGSIPTQRLVEAENTHAVNQNALDVLRAKAVSLHVPEAELKATPSDDAPPLRLSLISPIAGVVVHADVSVGKYVEPTEHLFEIVDTSRVWIKIGVLEQDLHLVQEGLRVRVSFSGLPGKSFEATVDTLGSSLDPLTHQGTASAEIANSPTGPQLLPGMNGQAEFVFPGRANRLGLPRTSIFSDGAERYVFVEEASTKESAEFRKQPVVLGRQTREFAEVLSGDVYPGDRVVTRGGHELSSLFFLGVLRLSPATAKSIGLKVEPVSEKSVEQIVRFDGAVEVPPQYRTLASSQLSGTLRRIRVDRGQQVKAGDILAEIASLELQDIQLEMLKAHLDGTMRREALRRLGIAGNAIPRRTLLEAESRANILESQFANLRQKLLTLGLSAVQVEEVLQTRRVVDAVPVRAPMDGVLVDFDRVLGQVVRADEQLFEIHDVSHVWIQAFVGERESSAVRPGQPARIRLVAYPEFEAEGTVARVGPVVGQVTRTQAAWIEFKSPPPVALQHNMLARVTLTTRRPPATLALPLTAIISDGLRSFTFVQKSDGTFERRRIEVGRADDRFIEIKSGLVRGENVAIAGVQQLQTAYSALR